MSNRTELPLTPRHISFLLYLYGYLVDNRIDSTTAVNLEAKFCGGEVEGLIPYLVCPHDLIEMDDDWCVFTNDGMELVSRIMKLSSGFLYGNQNPPDNSLGGSLFGDE